MQKSLWLLLSVLIGVCFVGCLTTPDYSKYDPLSWSQSDLRVLNCGEFVDCAPYEPCVQGGWVRCDRGHCAGYENDVVDIQCLIDVYEEYAYAPPDLSSTSTPSSQSDDVPSSVTDDDPFASSGGDAPSTASTFCGITTPPPEQMSRAPDRTSCKFFEGARAVETEFRPWIATTSDSGGAIKVLEFSVYGVTQDGRSVPLSGTAAGQPAITWVGTYMRDPWFDSSSPMSILSVSSDGTYSVPTGASLLHLGNEGGAISGYREAYAVLTVQTTGDAKVQIGMDYYVDSAWNHEGAVSSWVACTSGTSTLSSPRSNDPQNCSGAVGQTCIPTTETCNGVDDDCDGATDEGACTVTTATTTTTVVASSGCVSGDISVTAGPGLNAACTGGLQIVTWGQSGNEIASVAGAPLVIPYSVWQSWSGYFYTTVRCNGTYRSDMYAAYANAAQAGFSSVCSNGVDVTANTAICNDGSSPKLSVPIIATDAGRCQ